MKAEIVSNSKFQILHAGTRCYIFIPMSEEEQAILKSDIINPCWRIEVKKPKAKMTEGELSEEFDVIGGMAFDNASDTYKPQVREVCKQIREIVRDWFAREE